MKFNICKSISTGLTGDTHLSIALFTLLFVADSGCKKFLEVAPPNNALATASVFSDSISASSAITGIYSSMMEGNVDFVANLSRLDGLASDELIYNGTGDVEDIFNNNVQVNSPTINTLWTDLYEHIYQANAIINGTEGSTGITPSAQSSIIAEAKFIRALCNFYLVNWWGSVPLINTTNYLVTEKTPQAPTAQVYQQIIADLKQAEDSLSPNYVTTLRARPNSWTAAALLARVYLYTYDWVDAETQASSIINSGIYSLSPINTVFLNTSNETIWQLATVFSILYDTFDGNYFVPANAFLIPNYPLTAQLANAFETGDARKTSWVGQSIIGGQTYYYPFKYKNRRSTNPITEYEILFRLAEQYLIRAEARAQQNNLSGAIADLDTVRNRAGLANLSSSLTQPQVVAAVEQERRVELFAEKGHRWFDLKRWPSLITPGKTMADDVLQPIKTGWKSSDIYWPIPSSQILLNNTLVQNDGY